MQPESRAERKLVEVPVHDVKILDKRSRERNRREQWERELFGLDFPGLKAYPFKSGAVRAIGI